MSDLAAHIRALAEDDTFLPWKLAGEALATALGVTE